jgi:hypothetical protein
MSADKATEKQRGRPLQRAVSGNPAGRALGSRNRATIALEALLDGEGEAITRKAIELAKDGDMGAIRICLDRIFPPRKDRPVTFNVPRIETAADAAKAPAALTEAAATGELTPSEASLIGQLVDGVVRALDASELTRRIEALEQRANESGDAA